MVVDLHQLTVPVAKAAIRSALLMLLEEEEEELRQQQQQQQQSRPRTTTTAAATATTTTSKATSLVLITGIGRNSKHWLDPVLKPALIEWLASDFSPPLHAVELHDNPGRLGISAVEINNYFDNRYKRCQEQQ